MRPSRIEARTILRKSARHRYALKGRIGDLECEIYNRGAAGLPTNEQEAELDRLQKELKGGAK